MVQTVLLSVAGRELAVGVRTVIAAGYTGRSREDALAHIAELEELGVAPPPHVPMLYPVMPTLLTTSRDISVLGGDSTPEAEVAIVESSAGRFVTVASDHTDRAIEATSVPQSKNACPKVIGVEAWPIDEVAGHWDRLRIRSSAGRLLLQEGDLSMLKPLDEIVAFVDEHAGRQGDRVILSGTVPTLATPAAEGATIDLELHDPVLGRTISHSYTVHVMSEYF